MVRAMVFQMKVKIELLQLTAGLNRKCLNTEQCRKCANVPIAEVSKLQ